MDNTKINTSEFKEKIKKGLELSFKKLIQSKRLTNGMFIFSENGKIVKIKATDISE